MENIQLEKIEYELEEINKNLKNLTTAIESLSDVKRCSNE